MHPAKCSSRTPTNRNRICIVQGCESSTQKNVNLSFHAFPKIGERSVYIKNQLGSVDTIDRFKAWKRALKIKEVQGLHMRVCALHFTKEDYLFPDVEAKKRFLKKNAVPTINLPSSGGLTGSVKKQKIDRQGLDKLLKRDDVETLDAIVPKVEKFYFHECNSSFQEEIEEKPLLTKIELDHSLDQSFEHHLDNTLSMDNYFCANCKKLATPVSTKDMEIQVKTSDILPNFLDLFPTDGALKIATGIESYELLDHIVDLVGVTLKKNPNRCNSKMSLRNKVVMTYVKLKQCLTYIFLAGLFQYYTAQHCQRVFLEMIHLLGESLNVSIDSPSKEEIAQRLPQRLKGFENTRSMVRKFLLKETQKNAKK